MTLSELVEWVKGVPDSLPEKMRPMALSICDSFLGAAKRLMDLGLSYLTLDRSSSTLSTGERQRMQLARAVRNRTTGVLYVLDEPSIGLHPSNMEGLTGVMEDLLSDGNTVILVDHDTNVLKKADWMIEMGPEAGAGGGTIIAQGRVEEVEHNPASKIAGFLTGSKVIDVVILFSPAGNGNAGEQALGGVVQLPLQQNEAVIGGTGEIALQAPLTQLLSRKDGLEQHLHND
jgi:excinuclease ABC subunit A